MAFLRYFETDQTETARRDPTQSTHRPAHATRQLSPYKTI